FVFHLHHDYMVDDREQPDLDHWELTPGLSYGITDRLMVDLHGHFAKFGGGHLVSSTESAYNTLGPSPFIEAIALALQYQITKNSPVEIGITLGYEEPLNRSVELLDGQRVFAAALIVNKAFNGHRNLLVNFYGELEDEDVAYGWGIGFRSPLTPLAHGVAAGLELLGDFDGEYSILPGIYFPLGMQDIVFKTGLEFAPNQGATRSNITLMYRF
ncbi:MAG: hypothetical protein U9Q77_00025, partial [Candidatus Marinimicrobia bacterium]|nr:hypothetical protein [Candidatus Neomarinimicrobiota bacterium]